MASKSLILVEVTDKGVATVTLNRPEALNALTIDMVAQLAAAFDRLADDQRIKVAILTGAGRAFSAGIDLTAAKSVFQGDVKNEKNDPVVQMERCPFPIIGAINGFAVTGGFEIALACDILIASTDAKFMDTHCKFGLMPSWGLSQKLPRLIGANRARQVSLTALPLDAVTAEKWGLVSHAVAPDQLMPLANKLAVAICSNQAGLVRRYKGVLNDGLGMTLEQGRELERERAHEYYAKMKPEEFEAMQKYIQARSQSPSKKAPSKL